MTKKSKITAVPTAFFFEKEYADGTAVILDFICSFKINLEDCFYPNLLGIVIAKQMLNSNLACIKCTVNIYCCLQIQVGKRIIENS